MVDWLGGFCWYYGGFGFGVGGAEEDWGRYKEKRYCIDESTGRAKRQKGSGLLGGGDRMTQVFLAQSGS